MGVAILDFYTAIKKFFLAISFLLESIIKSLEQPKTVDESDDIQILIDDICHSNL